MQRKLDAIIESQLLVRVQISRTTRLFSLGKLAEGFGISDMTLHRYASPKFRELTNRLSQRYYYEHRDAEQLSIIECYRCGEAVDNHERCGACTILIHSGVTCGSQGCIDSLRRKKLRHYQIA